MADDDATAGRVGARLAEVREGNRLASELGYPRDPRDVPALLAAVEAAVEKVLALASAWRQKGLALGAQIAAEDMDGARAGFMMCTAQAYENCANATRMTISSALLGEDGQQ